MRGINWKVAVWFILLCAVLYASGRVMLGDPILVSLLKGLAWAAFFVPVFLWLTSKVNERLLERRPAVSVSRTRHRPEPAGDEGGASDGDRTPAVVGRRDGGGFYRQTILVEETEPAAAAAHLEATSSWRIRGTAAAEAVSLQRGSQAWLRLMGGSSRSRDRLPFLAHLSRHADTGALEVTVEDNFGRWLNLHSSGTSANSHVAAYGDELLDHIAEALETTGPDQSSRA